MLQRIKGIRRWKDFRLFYASARPPVGSKALQSVLIKLVATKQEAEVAKVVEKALESVNQLKEERGQRRSRPYQGGKGKRPFNSKCVACGETRTFCKILSV